MPAFVSGAESRSPRMLPLRFVPAKLTYTTTIIILELEWPRLRLRLRPKPSLQRPPVLADVLRVAWQCNRRAGGGG